VTPKLTTPGFPGEEDLRFWTNRLADPNFVYVIQGKPTTPIKVGVASGVQKRIAGLQTGNPQRLRLLYVLPGDYRLEAFLHRRLRRSRVAGEWFDGSEVEPTLRFIARLARQMRSAYVDGSAQSPSLEQFEPWKSAPRSRSGGLRVHVPDTPPQTPPAVAAEMRSAAPRSFLRKRT
jgi:hypothetical protein